jgi:transcriptional regulator with XRE-family HTH domain
MAKSHGPVGEIGAAINMRRRANGLSQKALAEMIGVDQTAISNWERGANPYKTGGSERTRQAFDQMLDLLQIQREGAMPRDVAPVPVTKTLRVALSTPEDEFAYSPRKIRHSLDYLKQNVEVLLERFERGVREIQRLEQSQGITQEELAVLRDKAGRYDQMHELIGKRGL